jgi:peptidoglycan/xylan/chitin deacetylase (PgdA/CDA1 family)
MRAPARKKRNVLVAEEESTCRVMQSLHGIRYVQARRRNLERLSISSQFLHLVDFAVRRPTMQLEKGALITSIDVDVGSSHIGDINRGRNDINVHEYLTENRIGEIEQKTIPSLIEFFNCLEIPVTFAVRGQLTEVKGSVLELLLESPVKHDIGAHGYYHKTFSSLSTLEAKRELELISLGMKKFNVYPKSFVFPGNEVAHLSLLEEFGYECYRGEGGLGRDGMSVKKKGRLYDIRPSFYLGVTYNPLFLNKIVDISTKSRVPFHLWFHPHDLYDPRERSSKGKTDRVLLPIYRYAKKKEKEGELNFETMYSIVEKISTTDSHRH